MNLAFIERGAVPINEEGRPRRREKRGDAQSNSLAQPAQG